MDYIPTFMMPSALQWQNCPRGNLIGLGGKHTSPLSFVTLHVQVQVIAGYDEDVVFLMVPDKSEFSQRVSLVIGTCTIGQIINVIWKSEIDHLSTPWATVRMV